LWLHYIDFEASRGNNEAAKNVLYRAIRAVPWYKEVWLRSIKAGQILELHEIVDLLQLMTEKELRLRTELPQFQQ
jgi:hypothetical protein